MGGMNSTPPPLKLNDSCPFSYPTLANTHGNEKDAPKDPMGVRIATGALQSEVAKPTHSGDDHAGCS